MILEAILYIVGFYIFAGLACYTYAVVKSFEILGFWDFCMTRTHIGVCTYPRWLLFWLYVIVKKIRGW